jgi:Peptidase family M1 domain
MERMNLFRKESGLLFAVLVTALAVPPVHAALPPGLPSYDVAIDLDIHGHKAEVAQRCTWTNLGRLPTQQLVFNVHSRYVVPDKDVGLIAKTLEILRLSPGDAMGDSEPPCKILEVTLPTSHGPSRLPFHFEGETGTTLVVDLPGPIKPGESITIQVDLHMHLPQKQGRWGQWRDVTFLSNWLPVFAFFGPAPPPREGPEKPKPGYDADWQPTLFVPWHQPFFNESSIYHVWVRLPADQKIATTGTMVSSQPLADGKVEVEIEAPGVRDFAFLCSARYKEFPGEAKVAPDRPPVRVHVLALPEHEHYARESVQIAIHALETYSRWFGPYPYQDFTIAEAYFGWNGNECSTLVMIDERVFGMPHLAGAYVDYLLSHEICHQWWYNMVGTNGYSETFMDEAVATWFSHRVLDLKRGKGGVLMAYPDCLSWLPNIRRDDYRIYGLYGTIARGEIGPAVQDLPEHGHVINLFSNCYDKGSRILAMIQERLGEAAFMQFMRQVFCKYQYRILRVADFQRELEAFTGQSWETFFHDWLYGKGLCDWAVTRVEVQPPPSAAQPKWLERSRLHHPAPPTLDNPQGLTRVVVILDQKAEINEPTTLGIDLPGRTGQSIRIPINPNGDSYILDEPPARVDCLGDNRWRVEVLLPEEPEQIVVDPDQITVDRNPVNNYWHTPIRWRFSPIYTFLEETPLTNAYDSWNVIFGPWIYGASFDSPWYTRAPMIGARAGLYHSYVFDGGVYTAYRTDFRDVVAGIDGEWDNWPCNNVQIGFNVEKRLGDFEQPADNSALRGVVYTREVFQYSSSLYLAPMNFLEEFASYQDNFLPFSSRHVPGAERFDHASTLGLHYQLNYLTPYWDAEGGFLFDAMYEGGVANLNGEHGMQVMSTRFSTVKALPNLGPLLDAAPGFQAWSRPVTDWIAATRLAVNGYGANGFPSRGEFFSLGGSQQFRGFDLSARQGSVIWGANVELRLPVARELTWDFFDHVMGVRNIYTAVFYDIGDAYVNNHSQGPVAHAVGAGLRIDVSWFGFVERSILRLDFAKCVNEDTPMQFWIGFQQPF